MKNLWIGACVALLLAAACDSGGGDEGSGNPPPANDEGGTAQTGGEEQPAPEPTPEPEPEPEATPPALAEVVNSELGYAINVPEGHEVRATERNVEYRWEMPDGWTQSAKVTPWQYPVDTEAQLTQHFRDSGFSGTHTAGAQPGYWTAVSNPSEVAGNTRQTYRVYIPGYWVECGGSQTHLAYNQQVCDSLRAVAAGAPAEGTGAEGTGAGQ